MKAENYLKYRSKEEIAHDERHDRHVANECDWETCSFCIAESEGIGKFVDEELDNDERRCPTCNSSDFTRDGDIDICVNGCRPYRR